MPWVWRQKALVGREHRTGAGQIAWLIPQEGVHYILLYKDLFVVARRDGIVVQPTAGGDDYGWNDANEEPNQQEAEAGVLLLKELFDRMAAMRQ